MKHYINYTEQGKILGFVKGDTDLNIEISNSKCIEGQSYNKIIIDGDNISFDKVDWRTPEEIQKQELQIKLDEALKYLGDTDFYYPRYLETGEPVPTDVVIKRQEYRAFLRENENVR